MYVVGLTGGIGSGKSTFASLLAERGAQVVDADLLGREALRPSRPAWSAVVETFGPDVLKPGSMEVDRAKLAGIVFDDPSRLAALNEIVHPVILQGIADAFEKLSKTDTIVVLDAALIVELGLHSALDALVVVDAPEDSRVQRLQRDRGMSPADISARMAAQAAREDVIGRADIVVNNDGDVEALSADADRVWKDLLSRAEAKK